MQWLGYRLNRWCSISHLKNTCSLHCGNLTSNATQPVGHWDSLSHRQGELGKKLTTHLHIVQRLGIHGIMYPLPHTSYFFGISDMMTSLCFLWSQSSPNPRVEIKKAWGYTFIPPYLLMMSTGRTSFLPSYTKMVKKVNYYNKFSAARHLRGIRLFTHFHHDSINLHKQ
jgi:hypothetical protein